MSAFANGNQHQDDDTQLKRDRPDSAFDRKAADVDVGLAPHGGLADTLRRTIENEIIPRLMLHSRLSAKVAVEAASGSERKVRSKDVRDFTDILLDGSPSDVAAAIDDLLGSGVSHAVIMLDLFAKSARRLGEMWETDERNFAEVTLAMGVLQDALHLLDGAAVNSNCYSQRKILLTPAAGEQHIYPVLILDSFFTRSGWQVERLFSYEKKRIEAFIKKSHVDVVGMSISREGLLDQLASDIQSVRRKSCNRSLVILVGGRVFVGHPELVAQVGADATAEDAGSAVDLAERLVAPNALASL